MRGMPLREPRASSCRLIGVMGALMMSVVAGGGRCGWCGGGRCGLYGGGRCGWYGGVVVVGVVGMVVWWW